MKTDSYVCINHNEINLIHLRESGDGYRILGSNTKMGVSQDSLGGNTHGNTKLKSSVNYTLLQRERRTSDKILIDVNF